MSAKGSERNARVATRRMTDVQKLVVRVLSEHGGEEHLGENDAAIELDEYMAAQGRHGSGEERRGSAPIC